MRNGGNLVGGDVNASGLLLDTGFVRGQRIASVQIGGSIIAGRQSGGGTLVDSGSLAAFQDLGPVTVKGGIIGNSTNPAQIIAFGQAAAGATTDLAIQSLMVGGRVEYASIRAGYGFVLFQPVAMNADAQIGPVSVGGDWIASSLVAGRMTAPTTSSARATTQKSRISPTTRTSFRKSPAS